MPKHGPRKHGVKGINGLPSFRIQIKQRYLTAIFVHKKDSWVTYYGDT